MHRSTLTRPLAQHLARTFARPFLLLLTATSVLGAAACAGDEILAPIDGTRCTAGTLREDRPVEGAVTDKSCVLWSHWEYEFLPTESWTLNMKANTAYIVRLSPTEVTPRRRAMARQSHGLHAQCVWRRGVRLRVRLHVRPEQPEP